MEELTLERVAQYIAWSHGRGAGVSSCTLLSYATSMDFVPPKWGSEPRDSGDLGRCIDMLRLFPEVRIGLTVAADQSPQWAQLVAEWDELERLYKIAEDVRTDQAWYDVYNKMRVLRGDEPVPVPVPKPEKKRRRR